MRYRLVGSTNDSTDYFYLVPETGEIKVLAPLTRAALDNYRVCVFVYKNQFFMCSRCFVYFFCFCLHEIDKNENK